MAFLAFPGIGDEAWIGTPLLPREFLENDIHTEYNRGDLGVPAESSFLNGVAVFEIGELRFLVCSGV